MPTRLSDYERHILWLIDRGLFGQPGNDRHPLVASLQEIGLVVVAEHGLELTAKGREALEGTAMSDSFDLSKLQPGDEVGIEQTWADGKTSQVVVLVTEVASDGFIEADEDWFAPDGRHTRYPDKRWLVAPTDEGRIVALREGIPIDLDILGSKVHTMDLPELKRFHAAVMGLAAEFGGEP